ncbi:MAG: hypothetical protein JNK82_14050, partial [Myxococcaceae bacterium]|nr:hypothetical protein [Myxococcaceae bacterium]
TPGSSGDDADGTNGAELWRLEPDGGTSLVKDINASSAGASSTPTGFAPF